MNEYSAVRLRPAAEDDDRALRRLAALDSAPPLRAPVVMAVADGELLAAVSLDDGRAVADPFRRTAHVLRVLREHARTRPDRQRAPRRPLRFRHDGE